MISSYSKEGVRETKKIMDIGEIDKMVQEALEHFKVTDEETESGFWTARNTEATRNILGVGYILASCGTDIKKARIIIDYEADYPLIVGRVIT